MPRGDTYASSRTGTGWPRAIASQPNNNLETIRMSLETLFLSHRDGAGKRTSFPLQFGHCECASGLLQATESDSTESGWPWAIRSGGHRLIETFGFGQLKGFRSAKRKDSGRLFEMLAARHTPGAALVRGGLGPLPHRLSVNENQGKDASSGKTQQRRRADPRSDQL